MALVIKDLKVKIEDKEILKGVDLTIGKGEIHALMGPNGSGKSTLANVLMGHPDYEVTGGSIHLDGEDITEMEPHQRSLLGLFLAFQYPVEITGVTVGKFLKRITELRRKKKLGKFLDELYENFDFLDIDRKFINRYLNEGFSGGEKKRMEILQFLLLQPHYALLDETDSGLDIDALKIVAKGVNKLTGPNMGVLIITHYQRILDYIKPHKVHVMFQGKIVKTGESELVKELEQKGYEFITGVKVEEPVLSR